MNRVFRGLLALTLLSSVVAYADDCGNNCCGHDAYPYMQIRSQGRNAARQLVGVEQFINRYDMECTNGMFSVALEYQKSFRNKRLAGFLFGKDLVNCCDLFVQGSQVADRHAKAWMADYFGLPVDFDGKVRFCPKIQNVIVDLDLYLGLDEAKEGLYFRINAPIVWTKWQLCPSETVSVAGENGFVAGYMAEAAVERSAMPANFLTAMAGGATWGDMKTPMAYGKINKCDCTKTRLAEIDFTLGWNFRLEEDSHLGVFLYLGVPTGNKPCSKYLFEPIVGNGKHWELGAGFSGSWIFWRDCECEERYMGLWIDATIAHLFKKCQCRSFDFCNKPNSRYMLLEEMEKNDTDPKINDGATPAVDATYKYKKSLIPAVNWSTFNVDVKINVQADVALKLGWVRDNWELDLGYNLYARTGEKFCGDNCCNDCDDCDNCCNDNCCGCDSTSGLYAIKGDAHVYGSTAQDVVYPLSATQSEATIYSGKNGSTLPTLYANPGVDNATDAFSSTDPLGSLVPVESEINTSIQPVLVKRSDLNMSKSPSMVTHKLFLNLSYAWKDRDECEDWVPFIGIGGEVEFAQDTDCCCDDCNSCNSCCTTKSCCDNGCCDNDCCDNCRKAGVSQWGIWVKGGVSFD